MNKDRYFIGNKLLSIVEGYRRPDETPVDTMIRIVEEHSAFRARSEFFRTAYDSMKAAHELNAAVAAPPREYRPRPTSLYHTLSVGGTTASISVHLSPEDDAPDLFANDSHNDLIRAMEGK